MTEDQLTAWRKAITAPRRQQRQQRGRPVRRNASRRTDFQPGMARVTPWEDDSVNEEAQYLRKLAREWRAQAQWIRDAPNGQEADRRAAAAILDSCAGDSMKG